jgi:hypothetical protein
MPEQYHDLFLPSPFQFILRELSHHSTLYSAASETVVKWHRKEEFGMFQIFESYIHRINSRAGGAVRQVFKLILKLMYLDAIYSYLWVPCYHGMARPQVAGQGM